MEVRSPLKWFQLEPKWPPVKITAVRCWRTKTANCVCKFDWGRWSSLLLRREASRHCCHQSCVHRYSPTLCTAPLLAACNTHTTATVSQRNVAQPKRNQSGHLFAILMNQFIQMFGRNTLAMLLSLGDLWSLGSSWIGSVVAATQSGTGHDAAAHAKENMEQGCKNESRPNCVSLEFQTHWISGSETILCTIVHFPSDQNPAKVSTRWSKPCQVKITVSQFASIGWLYEWLLSRLLNCWPNNALQCWVVLWWIGLLLNFQFPSPKHKVYISVVKKCDSCL